MSSRGNLQRKCIKGHPKAAGKCSSRCIRWYPRLELPRGPDSSRRFEALGGYSTRAQAEAALADALARRSHGFVLDPAKLTVNQYLDRWLAHIQTTLRARTVARYRTLVAHHLRPYIGAQLLKALQPLQVQAIYDQLALGGRRDGKPGGLAPQHILAVHRCLHRSLEQAVTWRLVARNVAKDATPPPRQHREAAALTPTQVAVLLDAAHHSTSPWLGPWTVLAAATGARNGELCGLEWADLDLDTGTVRFRQALTIVDPTTLPGTASDRHGHADARRKELAVGPVKSAASNAILTLPPFAVQALRHHRRQQLRLRLAVGQSTTVGLRWVEPGQPPARFSWTWCSAPSEAHRSTPTTPAAPSPASPPASAWSPIPTCCAMRWPRRWPPSGNRRASSPRSCAMPTGVRSPSASTSTSSPRPRHGWPGSSRKCSVLRHEMGGRCRQGIRWRETGGKARPQGVPDRRRSSRVSAAQVWCGRDRIRTCVGNAGDFTGRSGGSLQVPSHPDLTPTIAHDVRKRPVDSFGRPVVSPPFRPRPARPSVGRSESGAKSRPLSNRG
jgi:integrase